MSATPQTGDDGNLSLITSITALIITILSVCMFTTNVHFLIIVIPLIIVSVIYYLGLTSLNGNQQAVFMRMDKLTDRITGIGGWLFVWPWIEKLQIYEVGPFTLDIKYKDLTLFNLDNAEGTVQLTLQVNHEYFRKIYEITGDPFSRESMIHAVEHKLTDSVPAKLAIAAKEAGIKKGAEFEEQTKDKKSKLNANLIELLKDDSGGSCYGLELVKIEIPTPTMTGLAYNIERETQQEIGRQTLAKEKGRSWQIFLQSEILAYKKQIGKKETDNLTEDQLMYVVSLAERLYNDKTNVQYHQGLGNSQPIINHSKS